MVASSDRPAGPPGPQGLQACRASRPTGQSGHRRLQTPSASRPEGSPGPKGLQARASAARVSRVGQRGEAKRGKAKWGKGKWGKVEGGKSKRRVPSKDSLFHHHHPNFYDFFQSDSSFYWYRRGPFRSTFFCVHASKNRWIRENRGICTSFYRRKSSFYTWCNFRKSLNQGPTYNNWSISGKKGKNSQIHLLSSLIYKNKIYNSINFLRGGEKKCSHFLLEVLWKSWGFNGAGPEIYT